MLFSEREPSPSKYKYKRFGDETVNLYNCRSLAIAISFPESSFPLTSGSGYENYERLWDKAFQLDILLVRNRACAIVPEVRKR